MSDEGGVWRTVGGRHIFIKDGDDLATAMKKSGKFKNANTGKDTSEQHLKNKVVKEVDNVKDFKSEVDEYFKNAENDGINDKDIRANIHLINNTQSIATGKLQTMHTLEVYKDELKYVTLKSTKDSEYIKKEINMSQEYQNYLKDKGVFDRTVNFYGLSHLSDSQMEAALKQAEDTHMYFSQNDIDAMRRYMKKRK